MASIGRVSDTSSDAFGLTMMEMECGTSAAEYGRGQLYVLMIFLTDERASNKFHELGCGPD